MVALADVFDALTSRRCYKPAWPVERALDLIKDTRGKHFDPDVVDAFFARLDDVLEVKSRFQDPEPEPAESTEDSQ